MIRQESDMLAPGNPDVPLIPGECLSTECSAAIYEQLVTAAARPLADVYGNDRVARLVGEAIAVLVAI
jgi:hypothetical protein